MENKSSQDNPWSGLPTITTFDNGSSTHSTKLIDDTKNKKLIPKIMNKESSSILISSLINHLCHIIEKDPEQSKKLYYCLCDAMYHMNLIDPSYKLRAFELTQGKYIDAIYHLISVARSTINSDNTEPISRPIGVYPSLYREQFQETGYIAGGGFGSVYKAIHKLDEVEYAIKKIFVKPGKIKSILNYIEEVKTLAKLNHTNIVSYKQAWIEPTTLSFIQLPSISKVSINSNIHESEMSQSIENSKNEIKSYSYKSYSKGKTSRHTYENKSSSSSNEILNKQSARTCETFSDIVSFREENEASDISLESTEEKNMNKANSRTSSDESNEEKNMIVANSRTNSDKSNEEKNMIVANSTSEESNSSDESLENLKICQYSSQNNQYTILYIQMALCERTLRQWLDERTESTSLTTITTIATQILYGLNYIHSLKVVHHDIKPSNIFISTSGNLQVQLGDFGLACPLQRESHDSIVGTCMYAAPEQLKGQCNPKSDIYSLGVVFLELLIPMSTSMECIKMIEALKSGNIPAKLTLSHPKWVNTIMQMTEQNPVKRPSTDELLENLKLDKDLTISKLQDENSRLKNENSILQFDNDRKAQVIKDQQTLIESLQAQLSNRANQK